MHQTRHDRNRQRRRYRQISQAKVAAAIALYAQSMPENERLEPPADDDETPFHGEPETDSQNLAPNDER